MASNELDLQEPAPRLRRPYAAPANVVAVLHRCRTRNLPDAIDNDFLNIVGIPGVVFGRVREALRFLQLIGTDDRPTDTLEAIASATDEEYRQLLAATIHDAYAEDFIKIEPAHDSQAQIMNAFRRYQPRSQTQRMVMLFLGLCREAGLDVLEAPRDRQMRGTAGGSAVRPAKPRRTPTPPRQTPPPPPAQGGVLFGVTEADIAALADDEFLEVWAALGKVARARAAVRQRPQEPERSNED